MGTSNSLVGRIINCNRNHKPLLIIDMRNNKIFLFLATFCLTAGVFTSCQKDSVTLRLRMANFSNDTKVHMEIINGMTTPRWDSQQDYIYVNETQCTVSSNSVSVPPSIDYKAVYPASIYQSLGGDGVFHLNIPEIQVYKTVTAGGSDLQVVEAPMGAHSNTSGSSVLYFKNLGALLAITVENQAGHGELIVDKIIVTSSRKPLWGTATLAMPNVTTSESNGYNPYYVINEDDNTHKSVTLAGSTSGGSMGVAVAEDDSKQFYVYVPAFTSEPSNKFTFEVYVHNNSGEGVYSRMQGDAGNGNIPLNRIGSLTFELSDSWIVDTWIDNNRPAGALRQGEFTINQDGNKVYFSAGNLQYRPSDQKWRIAENQWDYVGFYNPGPTSTNASHYGTVNDGSNRYTSLIISSNSLSNWNYWIDLFGWGTSGYSPTGVTDQAMPFDYKDNKVYGGTEALDANYDWGRHNTIWYGESSSQPGTWRTLTYEEWQYLLGFTVGTVRGRTVGGTGITHRGLGKTYSIVKVNVNNVNITGLLIYPDDYQDGNRHPDTHDGTSEIDLSQYPSCAFLPCAGIRNGISTDTENNIDYPNIANLPGQPSWTNDNPLGYYWTATPVDGTYAGAYKFPTGNNKIEYNQSEAHRYKGCSVRLVTDVTSTSSSK